MPKRGRTAIQQSKREKAKVYFGECWTTPKKHWRDERSEIGLKHLQDVGDAPNTPKPHNQTKNTRRRNHKKYQRISNNRKKKGRPKENIWQKTSKSQEKHHAKLLKSPPTPVKTKSKNQKTDFVWNKNRVHQKILQCW